MLQISKKYVPFSVLGMTRLLQICDRILDSSLNYKDHTHDDERLLERSYYFNDICKERLLDLYVVA